MKSSSPALITTDLPFGFVDLLKYSVGGKFAAATDADGLTTMRILLKDQDRVIEATLQGSIQQVTIESVKQEYNGIIEAWDRFVAECDCEVVAMTQGEEGSADQVKRAIAVFEDYLPLRLRFQADKNRAFGLDIAIQTDLDRFALQKYEAREHLRLNAERTLNAIMRRQRLANGILMRFAESHSRDTAQGVDLLVRWLDRFAQQAGAEPAGVIWPDSTSSDIIEALFVRHATAQSRLLRALQPDDLRRIWDAVNLIAYWRDAVVWRPGTKSSADTAPALSGGEGRDTDQSKAGGKNVFRKKGQVWVVRYAGGEEFILLPSKGAAYLHQLLSQPCVRLSAIEMAYRVAKNQVQYALGDAGEKIDHEALAAYRARLIELREDQQKAKDNNDHGEHERIQQEIDSISNEIREAGGLGGRLRKDADDRERVRKAVGIAVKRATKEISQHDQRLAAHLSPPRLTCGRTPSYFPDHDVSWEV